MNSFYTSNQLWLEYVVKLITAFYNYIHCMHEKAPSKISTTFLWLNLFFKLSQSSLKTHKNLSSRDQIQITHMALLEKAKHVSLKCLVS